MPMKIFVMIFVYEKIITAYVCVCFFSFSLLFRSVHFDSCQKCIYISSNVSFHSVMLLYVFFPSLFNVRFSLLCALRYIPKYIISWNIPYNSSYIYLLFSTEVWFFFVLNKLISYQLNTDLTIFSPNILFSWYSEDISFFSLRFSDWFRYIYNLIR